MSTVDHPSHYNQISGIECIDVVENFNFNVGNAIKYLWRSGLKSDNPIEDLEKAVWYCQRELERVKRFVAQRSNRMTDEEEIESLEEDLNYMSAEMNEIKSKIAEIKLRIAKNAQQSEQADLLLPCGHNAVTSYLYMLGVCSVCNPEANR